MINKFWILLISFLLIACTDVKSLKIEAKNSGDKGFNESSIYFNTFTKNYSMKLNQSGAAKMDDIEGIFAKKDVFPIFLDLKNHLDQQNTLDTFYQYKNYDVTMKIVNKGNFLLEVNR
jgi:hypothetical protein